MNEISSVTIPSRVDPGKLTSILKDAGYTAVGGRRGLYERFAPPSMSAAPANATPTPSLVVPLDVDSPDYSDAMQFTLSRLAENRDLWIRAIYPRLAVDASDEFRFRRESNAPSGLIQWRQGERLIESARRTFLAGAKSYMEPVRHFVNRHGRFAGRYLDQILMGQTAPGSYIVTAYAPPNAAVAVKGSADTSSQLTQVGSAQVRAVNEAVVRAVEATAEALDHYRNSGSLSGFEDGVRRGVSYEMTNAILGIADNAEEANIAIEWDSGSPAPQGLDSQFTFHAPDVEPLSRAAVKLAEDASTQVVNVMGRVHLLAKKKVGSPGVFGIDSLQPEGPRKVRVRLADEEDYHAAVYAHDEDLALLVSGTLEKEGNLSWLYNATVIRTLGPIEEFTPLKQTSPAGEEMPGQLNFFSEDG